MTMDIDKQAIIGGYLRGLRYNAILYNGDLPREFIDNTVSGQMIAHAQAEVEAFLEQAQRLVIGEPAYSKEHITEFVYAFIVENPELVGQLIVRDRNGADGGFASQHQFELERIAEKMQPVYLAVNHNDELAACFY